MEINLHFHEVIDKSVTQKIDWLIEMVKTIIKREIVMSKELDALTAEVAAVTTVEQSAIALLQGLSAQITALKTDPVALQKLADDLTASSTALADAVAANTPATEPPPEPTE